MHALHFDRIAEDAAGKETLKQKTSTQLDPCLPRQSISYYRNVIHKSVRYSVKNEWVKCLLIFQVNICFRYWKGISEFATNNIINTNTSINLYANIIWIFYIIKFVRSRYNIVTYIVWNMCFCIDSNYANNAKTLTFISFIEIQYTQNCCFHILIYLQL